MKQTILEAIKSHGPIKRVDLLRRVNATMEVGLFADRTLRQAISDLIGDGEPIASSEKGYSIIQNVDQLHGSQKYLKSKAIALFQRAKYLHLNFYKDKDPQLSIESFLNSE